MGKTTRVRDTLYIDAEKFERLQALAKTTRIPRAELLREAVDDLLVKHGALKGTKKKR